MHVYKNICKQIKRIKMPKRKIPAKKHHGVKDPYRQAAERHEKIKDKINNPPEKGDQQKIPYKLVQFMKMREDIKSGKKIKLIKNIDNEDKPKNSRNKIKQIKQQKTENDEDYLKRVNRITTESLKEAEYEAKYGVEVVRNTKTGEISIKKKPKNEIDELLKQKGKKLKKTIKKDSPIDAKTKKDLIKQVLQEEKLKKKTGGDSIQEYKKDIIKFGEIVHAPPTLSVLPRKAQKSDTVPRPGRKNNLLLKNLLNEGQTNTTETEKITKIKTIKNSIKKLSTNLKGKRKDLSVAARRMIEDEQTKVVELYRKMKKDKMKTIA